MNQVPTSVAVGSSKILVGGRWKKIWKAFRENSRRSSKSSLFEYSRETEFFK